jgi:hypothetical protein
MRSHVGMSTIAKIVSSKYAAKKRAERRITQAVLINSCAFKGAEKGILFPRRFSPMTRFRMSQARHPRKCLLNDSRKTRWRGRTWEHWQTPTRRDISRPAMNKKGCAEYPFCHSGGRVTRDFLIDNETSATGKRG